MLSSDSLCSPVGASDEEVDDDDDDDDEDDEDDEDEPVDIDLGDSSTTLPPSTFRYCAAPVFIVDDNVGSFLAKAVVTASNAEGVVTDGLY